jgi:uncharacterized protein (TIGR03790 family)
MSYLRFCLAALFLASSSPAFALEPGDVYLAVNKNVPASRQVAEHYCRLRKVPRDHIIPLDLPMGEDISRADYDKRLAAPLRTALKARKDRLTVLVTVHGVPLRVGRAEPSADEKAALAKLTPELKKLADREEKLGKEVADLEKKAKGKPAGAEAGDLKERRDRLAATRRELDRLRRQESRLAGTGQFDSTAAVDSELSLLWWGKYELRGWQLNTLHWRFPEKARREKPPVLLVSRLDGPTPDLAKRLVDRALAAEKKGLSGKVYVDARGIGYDPKADPGYGYGGYDESLRETARLLSGPAKMDVTLDDKPGLFAEGSCPDCALYCGWYSLARYVPCCKLRPGAVAYHIASSEAVSLRDPKSKLWCKCLLEDGAAATLGPVAEPFTVGFPKPAEFFGFLVTGKYTLVECYYRTLYLNSWMTVLVGDPLYNPYAKSPRLKPAQVKPSPKGGKPLVSEK